MTKLFFPGAQYPPAADIPRLAKYKRGKAVFDGRHPEIYDRASALLKDTPHAAQLKTLFIAVNLMDVLLTKPADLMVGDPPTFDSGKPDDTTEQSALSRIVEENDVTQLIHESVIGAGIRGDSFIKTAYAPRADVSETEAIGLDAISDPEPIIESVDARFVFPELSRGSRKRFKAVNIAWIEWIEEPYSRFIAKVARSVSTEVPYLNVERHIPGYIIYEKYRLSENGVDTSEGVPIETYIVGEQVATERVENVVETGTSRFLVHHIPYKSVDNDWRGISGVEKIESVLAAINDRLVQIDYILWKHADPTAYGPDITEDNGEGAQVRFGGKYIPVGKEDQTPGYMVWESQLEGAFKELDILIGLIFQMSETPQWLFGTTLASDKGGTGTSHTDAGAIKARFMPILSKVKRIRVHVDKAIRDALWTAMELENFANKGVEGFVPYTPIYPKITWQDGIPRDEKYDAEVAQIRTGNKPTLDVHSAIKRLDNVDDSHVSEIITRIDGDEIRANGTVDGSVFNASPGGEAA
ncbi:phage portal protein [Cohnella mopanensis]|uniref:phage portal protein n=1 Tax=Cohnella mopanensis TaxID=2911966 RepID=UPI001EF7B3D4|nr:phage portal protein [Cohnella mopanensis]